MCELIIVVVGVECEFLGLKLILKVDFGFSILKKFLAHSFTKLVHCSSAKCKCKSGVKKCSEFLIRSLLIIEPSLISGNEIKVGVTVQLVIILVLTKLKAYLTRVRRSLAC